MQFKGTKDKWYAVQYACYFNIQTSDYYITDEGKMPIDVLNAECVTEDVAKANAQLCASAPDLLNSLMEMVKVFDYLKVNGISLEHEVLDTYNKSKEAIYKALNTTI